jgi:hypothetical protein
MSGAGETRTPDQLAPVVKTLPRPRPFSKKVGAALNVANGAERIVTTIQIRSVLAGVLSGPLLSALLLLIPLGVLTGLNVALDPSLAIDEFAPEEELFIPFILIAIFISTANGRFAWAMSGDNDSARIFEVTSGRYLDDSSGASHPHGHRGRQLLLDFIAFLANTPELSVTVDEPVTEDYGWKLSIRRDGFSPIWIVVAHEGPATEEELTEKYTVAVTLLPPFLPWRRLTFKPDFTLREKVERQFIAFLRVRNLSFDVDLGEWVDPGPGIAPGPMF